MGSNPAEGATEKPQQIRETAPAIAAGVLPFLAVWANGGPTRQNSGKERLHNPAGADLVGDCGIVRAGCYPVTGSNRNAGAEPGQARDRGWEVRDGPLGGPGCDE